MLQAEKVSVYSCLIEKRLGPTAKSRVLIRLKTGGLFYFFFICHLPFLTNILSFDSLDWSLTLVSMTASYLNERLVEEKNQLI